jgi:hypothetical protein
MMLCVPTYEILLSSVGIHAFATAWIDPQKVMDHRVKPGDDDKERRSRP